MQPTSAINKKVTFNFASIICIQAFTIRQPNTTNTAWTLRNILADRQVIFYDEFYDAKCACFSDYWRVWHHNLSQKCAALSPTTGLFV